MKTDSKGNKEPTSKKIYLFSIRLDGETEK